MLKELKELKKISDGQKDMTNVLKRLLAEVTQKEEQEVYIEHKYYEDLTKEEKDFFLETVFNIIEDQIENDFKNIIDIGFHKSGKKEICNIYLDLDQNVPKSDMSNIKVEESREWMMHIKLIKDSGEIRLDIKDEDMVLQCDQVSKINDSFRRLKKCYNDIKKTYVISIFDDIIKRAKLSRSEFLDNFDFDTDE